MKKYLIFTSIGFELAGLMVGAIFLSQSLEAKFQTGGLILVTLLLSVLAGWLVHVVWLLKKLRETKDDSTT